ncbi:MAG TPA: YdeI/OmpD-associated family protein [Bacteroidia bacterium]|nr:YdeI/OmpD-associated family protein [Bacteroidia bacterium]
MAKKSDTNPTVDFYFSKEKNWHTEIEKLRDIALECGLAEELKWGCPCYSLNGNNIVLIHVFKNYCAFLFFKGVLLQDEAGILIQQTKNVQAARQIRFTSLKEITSQKTTLKAYIFEAIEVERAGLKVELKKTAEFEMAEEFAHKLKKMPALKKAFYALTPGRQRGYLLYFSQAKQAKTREARIEKCVPQIMNGKGLDD